MSVDDILDLRAGEPTAAFSAASVRHKVDELDFSSLNIAQSVAKAEEPATPRDLFADAMAEQSEDTVPDGEAQQTQPAADFVPQTSPQADPSNRRSFCTCRGAGGCDRSLCRSARDCIWDRI